MTSIQLSVTPSKELEVKAARSRTWRRGEGRLGCEGETVDHMWGAPKEEPW